MDLKESERQKAEVKNPGDSHWRDALQRNRSTGEPSGSVERPLSQESERLRQLSDLSNRENTPQAPQLNPREPDLRVSETKVATGGRQQQRTSASGWFKRHKKKVIWSLIGLGGAGSIFGLVLVPNSFIGENLKINFTKKWSYKHINIGSAHRSASVQSKQYFGIPGCDDKKRWSCYNNRGVTQKHIDRLKFLGFEIEGQRPAAGDSSRFQMDALTLTDASGQTTRITSENFIQQRLHNPVISAAFKKVFEENSLNNRNKRMLAKLRTKGITRKGIPSDGTREENERSIRQSNVDSANSSVSTDTPDKNDESESDRTQRTEGANLIERSIEDARGDVDNYIEGNGNPDNIPSTSELNDTAKLAQISQTGGSALMGAIKGGAQGPLLNTVSNACTYYQSIRLASLLIQVSGQAQVIRAVYELFSTSDGALANDTDEKGMSMLGDILTRPSSEEATKGMTLGDAPAYTLITQGAVANIGDLSRYNAGFTPASGIQSLLSTISGNENQLKTTCGAINSTGGQITLSIIGVAACLGTVGASCLAGAATGVVAGGILAALAYYILPTIANIVVGTYVLDYFNDPQGSYGVANLMGYGSALLGSEAGQAAGFGALSRSEYVALEDKTRTTQKTIAMADAINYREDGLFKPSNPMSITTQVASALLPYRPTSFTATEILSKAQNITQRSLGTFGSELYAASPLDQGSTLSDYRPDLCQSPTYQGVDSALTGFCTEIKGPLAHTLPPVDSDGHDQHPYSFENLADWMQDNDHIDEAPDAIDIGEPLGEAKGDFRKYIDECRSDDSLFRDFDGQMIDINGESRKDCDSDEEKFTRFDAYIQYRTVISGVEDAGNGELGGGDTIEPDSSDTLVDGTAQELAQKIVDSDSVTGDARYISQIQSVADGDDSCHINPTVLQLVVTMMRAHTMHISSLNRYCTNVLTASGTASYHYREGGGHAIDFSIINGVSSTGGTDEDIKFMKEAASFLPEGSGFGQVNCRARIELPGMRQFNDTCHHVHIEVPVQ